MTATATDAPPVPSRGHVPEGTGVFLALGIAALLLFALWKLAPDPVRIGDGLRVVERERLQVLEPGLQGHARNPASALWALPFEQQFDYERTVLLNWHGAHSDADDKPTATALRQWNFTLSEADRHRDGQALLAPNAGGDMRLYINGIHIANDRLQPAYGAPGLGGHMLESPLPSEYYLPGSNRIDIVQTGDPTRSGLRVLYIGNRDDVIAASNAFRLRLVQLRFGAMIATATGVLSVVLILFAGGRRVATLAIALLCGAQVAALVAPHGAFAMMSLASALLALAGGLLAVWTWHRPRDATGTLLLALALTSWVSALCGLALMRTAWLPIEPLRWLHIANSGTLPLLLLGAPLAALRSWHAIALRLRQARVDLAEKDRIIAEQQKALDDQIRNAAIHDERQRFARDMHDGLGGHLQGLLMRVRADRITADDLAVELQSGLNDLRLMVDSLDQLDTDLYTALEHFRMRALPQLQAAGIALDWKLAEGVRALSLDARDTLNIYRVLQEILSNCMRHARAGQLGMDIGFDAASRVLIIATDDDGCGFDEASLQGGKGLQNLRKRVAKAGGEVSIHSVPGAGTHIMLRIPIQADAVS